MAQNLIKFNSRAFHQILNSGGTARAVSAAAYRIKAGAPGTVVRTRHGGFGGGRPIAYVVTQAKTPEEAEEARESLESAVV